MGDATLPDGQMVVAGPRPIARHDIVVDIAEVNVIQTVPSLVTGTARKLYRWLNLQPDHPFPEKVIE